MILVLARELFEKQNTLMIKFIFQYKSTWIINHNSLFLRKRQKNLYLKKIKLCAFKQKMLKDNYQRLQNGYQTVNKKQN